MPFVETYTKTISYLRGSHSSPQVEPSKKLLHSEEGESSVFVEKLEDELDKFNRLKNQKQKEAKAIYEEEMRRLKTLQDLKEKEDRIVNLQARIMNEKKLHKEKVKEMAKDKLEKLRNLERSFVERKKQEKENIRKKLEKLKQRQLQLLEEKELQRKEVELKQQQKQIKLETMKNSKDQREMDYCLQQMDRLEQKMNFSKELHESVLVEKVKKVKEKLEQESEISGKTREDHFQEKLNKLVEKMVTQTKNLKVYEQNKRKDDFKRKKAIEEKEVGVQSSQAKIDGQKKKRIKEILEKEKRIDDAIKQKKKLEEESIFKKQQLRKLREEDKNENYDMQKRREEYRLEKMLDKEQKNKEKLTLMKSQQEILRLARLEVSVQSRVEKNRIIQGIEEVKKILNSQKPNTKDLVGNISEREKSKTMKILKTIFKDDEIDTTLFQLKPKDKKNQSATIIQTPVEPEKKAT